MSSEKQLVCADWQLIALWFNLVRDFQKCCVHSDLEIGAPCSLCVQNFNAPKKKKGGDKGPPWWCHSAVSKQALAAGEGARTGHTVTITPPPPSTMAPAPHPDGLWANASTPDVKFKTEICVFKIFLTLHSLNLPTRNWNPSKWCIDVMFLDTCHSNKLLLVFNYHQCHEKCSCPFISCLHTTDCPFTCDTNL